MHTKAEKNLAGPRWCGTTEGGGHAMLETKWLTAATNRKEKSMVEHGCVTLGLQTPGGGCWAGFRLGVGGGGLCHE